jgi:glucose-6-phosphate 1-epimerase
MVPSEFPSVRVQSADGARADIALDGAHVTSWIPAGAQSDRLFLSARSRYGPGQSIRGGIPVIFPQFGAFGPLPQHGFARRRRWTLREQREGVAVLRLTDDEQSREEWPHQFTLDVEVQVERTTLAVAMTVENTGDADFAFTAAFHPYFAVQQALDTSVVGLQGCRYRDALRNGDVFTERATALDIVGALDRIFFDAPDVLVIRDGDRQLTIEKRGFPDAVVWNPGSAGTSSRVDFAPGDEAMMLCVEAAVIGTPVTLSPGARWTASQIMHAG